MTAESVVALALGVLAFAAVVVLVLVLYRHTKLLARSVAEFQSAVRPIVEDIQREASQAAEHAAKLSEGIPSREPGARIRR